MDYPYVCGYNADGILYNEGIVIEPAVGAILMSLSTVVVAMNARFLKKSIYKEVGVCMFINRFPKMAALQKYRALALGFEEPIAEAIGIAEATKYAIFKNLSYKRRTAKEREYVHEKLPTKALDETTFSLFKLQALDGLPFVSNRVYTPQDYQRALFLRWGSEVAKKIEEWAKNIIKNCPEEILKSENKFFNECWKPHRDENP